MGRNEERVGRNEEGVGRYGEAGLCRGVFEGLGAVGSFPGEEVAVGGASEVSAAGGGGVDGFAEGEGFDDALGGEGEDVADGAGDADGVGAVGALAVDEDAGGFGDADGVAELDFAGGGQAGGDDVLGDVSGHVGGGAIDLCGVFSAEGAAAVSCVPAVGIDDDFSACESGVAVWAADFEAAGGVDVDFDAVGPPRAAGPVEDGADDVGDDFAVEVFLSVVPGGVVLRGEDDGVDARGSAAEVLDGDLALGVWPEAGDEGVAAGVFLSLGEGVCELDGEGHEFGGLVAGEAEHHALVARAAGIDAHGDLGGLAVERGEDGAGVGVEAHSAVGVADAADGAADEVLEFDVGAGGDFAGDDDEAGGAEGFAGDAGHGVLTEHFVEDGVGDLVRNLVGVSDGDGFGGEEGRVFVLGGHGEFRAGARRGGRLSGFWCGIMAGTWGERERYAGRGKGVGNGEWAMGSG